MSGRDHTNIRCVRMSDLPGMLRDPDLRTPAAGLIANAAQAGRLGIDAATTAIALGLAARAAQDAQAAAELAELLERTVLSGPAATIAPLEPSAKQRQLSEALTPAELIDRIESAADDAEAIELTGALLMACGHACRDRFTSDSPQAQEMLGLAVRVAKRDPEALEEARAWVMRHVTIGAAE